MPEAFGSKAKRKGLRRPEANVSWHFLPMSVRPVRLQRALSCARIRVGSGDAAVAGYSQYLAQEDVRVAGGVVLAAASRVARIVACAFTYRDVEVAVLAEVQIPRVVVMHVGYVVHEYLVGCGAIGVGEHIALHSVDRYVGGIRPLRTNAVLLKSIEEVDVVVGGEVWVHSNPE